MLYSALVVCGRTVSVIGIWLMVMVTIPRVSSRLADSGNSSISIQHRLYQSKQMLMDSEADILALSGSHKFRSARSHREPKFISFNTKNDNIEIEIDFNIPFLTVPVKDTVDGMMNSVKRGIPTVNVNVGAIILAGVLAVAGAIIGSVVRLFKDGDMMKPLEALGLMQSGNRMERGQDHPNWSSIWTVMEVVDKSLQKFDIDSTACTQRATCWYVKEAMNNVHENRANKLDIVINGLSGASWALQFTTGTAIEEAIRAGRRNLNCEQAFPACRIKPEMVQRILKMTRSRRK